MCILYGNDTQAIEDVSNVNVFKNFKQVNHNLND